MFKKIFGIGGSASKEKREEAGSYPSAARLEREDVAESSRHAQRIHNPRRPSRPDFSSFLLGITQNHEAGIESLEARRESKAEKEARKQARERDARLMEREQSMREEHVDGGYLVTQGVYVGVEDYDKLGVRRLMIERRLAPFWRGLDDYSTSWAEHQLVAAARGMPIPLADQVPPELEYHSLGRTETQDSGCPATPAKQDVDTHAVMSVLPSNIAAFPATLAQPSTSPSASFFRPRARTLASLGSLSRSGADQDLSTQELKLPRDPFINGQPVEVFLYKDASECPICFLYYPPYLNATRCCEQPICSECFVQIKRPDPHVPEHTEPDLNAPAVTAQERMEQAEGMLISEVSCCPYCNQKEFGITYTPPPFRRGLTYAQRNPFQVGSAMSSSHSLANSIQGPPRRRGTSLSANAPEVVTTDRIRPDWAEKLATARAHAARRSAAASALHAAAYMMNDRDQQRGGSGPFSRRSMLRRATLDHEPSDAQLNAMAFLASQRGDYGQRRMETDMFGSRRSRVDDLEDLMMMEAIRLSLAAEEDRRKREEKEAKKKAKEEAKQQKKEEKAARKAAKHPLHQLDTNEPESYIADDEPSLDDLSLSDKGKASQAGHAQSADLSANESFASIPPPASDHDGDEQGSTSGSVTRTYGVEAGRGSHLRNISNISSVASSLRGGFPASPPATEPMFNFNSLVNSTKVENLVEHTVSGAEGVNENPIGHSRHAQLSSGRSPVVDEFATAGEANGSNTTKATNEYTG